MLILALETSTLAGSVAVMDASPGAGASGEKILAEYTLNVSNTHSERLMPAIDRLLKEISVPLARIQGIALALGPGSFTGLRIGVSTVKGLAYALKVPVAGVSTLDALAQNIRYSALPVCPVLDARKKEVYAALFRGNEEGELQKIGTDWVLSPEDLCSRIQGKTIFLGNGLEVCWETLRTRLGPKALFAPPELGLPRAANVARLALEKFQKGLTLDLFSFHPIYLRKSEAEIHHRSQEILSPALPE